MPDSFFFPGIPLVLVLAFLFWVFQRERKRRAGLQSLAAKYSLETEPRTQSAPDPDIRGLLMPAITSRYMQGRIGGVSVVAFDYSIGWGRGRMIGSCAGVHRRGLDFLPPSFAPVLVHEGDWTFLRTDHSGWRRGRRLRATEIDQLWNMLLHAPGPDGSVAEAADVPGGIVIRPARLG